MFRSAEKTHGGFAYGLYDIYSNIGYITLGASGDTSEFGCACIRNWWTTHGKSEFLFETGRKTADGFKENMKIHFDEFLPKWNYAAVPSERL
ncbi:MAG: ISAzo13-like element transposase-related protein [Candidatus Electrothrix sp. YB6]